MVDTVSTPNIDGLADDGVRFENAFCTAPQCSPSRASLVTGRYPHDAGVLGLVHRNFGWDLNEGAEHVAGLLSGAGYRSTLVGLQHATRRPEAFFDEIRLDPDSDDGIVPDESIKYDRVAAETADALADLADREEPFFLQAGLVEPHRNPPWGGEMYWKDVFDDDEYGDEATVPPHTEMEGAAYEEMCAFERAVELVDQSVGTVLDALDREGLEEETLVVVTADHGLPLPRAKCSPYDVGNEIMFVARLPAGASATREELVSNADLVPTVCEVTGVDAPAAVQGRSFAPLLTGEGGYEPRDAVFGELTYHGYYDPRRWVHTGDRKLVLSFSATHALHGNPDADADEPPGRSRFPDRPNPGFRVPVELYDLEADPVESENLAYDPDYAAERDALLDRLGAWMERTGDPLLDPGPTAGPMHDAALDALDGDVREHIGHQR
jgi:arylsulfatase A-like enzyme